MNCLQVRTLFKVGILTTIISILLVLGIDSCYAQTSTVQVSDSVSFGLLDIQFGTIIGASNKAESDMILEAKPFLGAGLSAGFDWRKTIGIFGSILVYTTNSDAMSVLTGAGFIFKEKWAIGPYYDFGDAPKVYDEDWKNRLKVLLTYDLR